MTDPETVLSELQRDSFKNSQLMLSRLLRAGAVGEAPALVCPFTKLSLFSLEPWQPKDGDCFPNSNSAVTLNQTLTLYLHIWQPKSPPLPCFNT